MPPKSTVPQEAAELRRRAEARLRQPPKQRSREAVEQPSMAETQRLLHELQVHQVELEMQNTELQRAREDLELALEKFTDLYDFAPVGYFSLDEGSCILEVNLTGAALVGVERSHLIRRRFQDFVAPASRAGFLTFFAKAVGGAGRDMCELLLNRKDAAPFWGNLQVALALAPATRRWWRLAVSDITALKRAEQAQQRLEVLDAANRVLQREIEQRRAAEQALKQSEEETSQLLQESLRFQTRLRILSRRLIHAQDEERKRISRELHDVIAQTLAGINVQLTALGAEARLHPRHFHERIHRTQRAVEEAVNIVHRFARELRPAALDDLGLIPALHSLLRGFAKETGVRASLTAFAGVEKLSDPKRSVLYRIAQEALSNVTRHARAGRVDVSLQKLGRAIVLEIHDDGRSFDVAKAMQSQRNTRLGLIGMRERAEMVGGQLAVESSPGRGTTLRALIPFRAGSWAKAQSPPPSPAFLPHFKRP